MFEFIIKNAFLRHHTSHTYVFLFNMNKNKKTYYITQYPGFFFNNGQSVIENCETRACLEVFRYKYEG